jgi:acylphosphatase
VSAARVCQRCIVSGRVQGVFYRATIARAARDLGVEGYARNLADGRVEVLACGDTIAVESLVRSLWTGSSASKVTDVSIETVTEPANLRGFVTR